MEASTRAQHPLDSSGWFAVLVDGCCLLLKPFKTCTSTWVFQVGLGVVSRPFSEHMSSMTVNGTPLASGQIDPDKKKGQLI